MDTNEIRTTSDPIEALCLFCEYGAVLGDDGDGAALIEMARRIVVTATRVKDVYSSDEMLEAIAWALAAIERLCAMAKANAVHATKHDALETARDDLNLAEMSETLRITALLAQEVLTARSMDEAQGIADSLPLP